MRQSLLQTQPIADQVGFHHIHCEVYKTDYIHVFFSLPLSWENAAETALLSRMLLRGCAKYPTLRALHRALDESYSATVDADVFKVGENQVLEVSASCLADDYALNAESITGQLTQLLTQVIFEPYVTDGGLCREYLEGERQNAKDQVRARFNNKMSYARTRMYELMCENERFCVDPLGREQDLDRPDGQSLLAAHGRLLEQAHVEIFHVGRSGPEPVYQAFCRGFAGVKRRPLPVVTCEPVSAPAQIAYHREQAAVTQANLAMGFRTDMRAGDPRQAVFSVFNALFGGTASSKLFMNVREKMSLCYSIGSRPVNSKGVLSVVCGIDGSKQEAARQEILRQLDGICRGDITADELEQNRNVLLNSLAGLEDTPSSLADWYYPRVLFGDRADPVQVMEQVQAVTADQVAQIAQTVKPACVYCLEGGDSQ